MLRRGRTAAALALTCLAVALPCSAWYLAGSRSADEQASRLEQAPVDQARETSKRLARQVAERLATLMRNESRRPVSDYDAQRDPFAQNCSNELQVGAAIAGDPADSLVLSHFQIDEFGQITLPPVTTPPGPWLSGANPSEHEPSIRAAIRDGLECAGTREPVVGAAVPSDTAPRRVLTATAGVVVVGPFSWRSVEFEDRHALLAIREVRTAGAVVNQGFVVAWDSLQALVRDTPFPAEIRPGEPRSITESSLPIEGDPWTVVVDSGEAVAAARREGNGIRTRFRGTFGLGALAALLAGSCVVLLVYRTDRMAGERSRFAASAAHELRTPLAGMQLYAEMLAGGKGDPSRSSVYAGRIAEEASRLGRVVSNVLGYSSLEQRGLQARPVAGDLRSIVGETVERLRPSVEAVGASVRVDLQDGLPPALFDRDAVQMILQNLVDNAEKYSRQAGDREIRISLRNTDGVQRVSVLDRGPGIPRELRGKLFRPFCRLADADAPAGLGIGLALVRALARAQGATVTHHDAPGGGSCFHVDFAAAGAA